MDPQQDIQDWLRTCITFAEGYDKEKILSNMSKTPPPPSHCDGSNKLFSLVLPLESFLSSFKVVFFIRIWLVRVSRCGGLLIIHHRWMMVCTNWAPSFIQNLSWPNECPPNSQCTKSFVLKRNPFVCWHALNIFQQRPGSATCLREKLHTL